MQTKGIRRYWAGGFTLAEILMTLVILGFIGALGVPMLGQQKVNKPLEIKAKHGTIECFWVDDKVKAWVSNNEDNQAGHFGDDFPKDYDGHLGDALANGEALTDGEACYFKVPKASVYIFEAVGAGGIGAKGLTSAGYEYANVLKQGNIPTDQNFYEAITDESVPQWVRKNWNKIWENTGTTNYISYDLTSPIGASGSAACKQVVLGSDECANMCDGADITYCTEKCLETIEAKGGDSGKGGVFKVRTPIYFSVDGAQDQVVYDTSDANYVKLKIGDKSATVQSSGKGGDAVLLDGKTEAIPGAKGANVTQASLALDDAMQFSTWNPTDEYQIGASGCIDSIGKVPIFGSISNNNPESIHYYSNDLGIRANFGLAGDPGSVKLRMLERLPSNVQVRLIPAKDGGESTISIRLNDDDEWHDVVKAASGADGSFMQNKVVPINDQNDLPFPKEYYPDSFVINEPNFTILTGDGYTSYIANSLGYFPGTSGAGVYPIVYNIAGTYERYFEPRSGRIDIDRLVIKPIIKDKNVKCIDDSEPVNDVCGQADNPGIPGAAIVSW